MRLSFFCLLFALLSVGLNAHAQPQYGEKSAYQLSEWDGLIRLCEMPEARLLKSIAVGDNGDSTEQVHPFTCQIPALADTVYTILFRINNDLTEAKRIYFYSGFNDVVEITILNEDSVEQTLKVGYRVPAYEATFEKHYFYTAFTLQAQTRRDVIVKVKNRAKKKAEFVFALHDEVNFHKTIHAFRETHTTSVLIATFFEGALGFMVLFMAFLYIKNRQVIYLYYAIYLTFCVLYVMLNMPRLTLVGQWVDYWPPLRIYAIEPVQFISFAAYNMFALELLQIRNIDKKLYKIL